MLRGLVKAEMAGQVFTQMKVAAPDWFGRSLIELRIKVL
jgi:hypothetical protein